ncbi:FliO/MopB family protein [Candidatus Margulisiibacteriota bacterium]
MHKKLVIALWLGGLVLLLTVPQVVTGATVNGLLRADPSGFSPQVSYLASSTDYIKYIAKVFFYLFFAMGVLFIGAKVLLGRGLPAMAQEKFRIIKKLPLEVQASVYLVQVGEKFLLIGVGGKQISYLKEIPKEEIELFLQKPFTKSGQVSFKDYLKKFIGEKKQ